MGRPHMETRYWPTDKALQVLADVEQPAMFDQPTSGLDRPPPCAKTKPPTGAARWTRHRPRSPERCDDCVAVLAATQGTGPRSRHARWKRTTPSGVLLLCSAHMETRRVADGLKPLKDKGPQR